MGLFQRAHEIVEAKANKALDSAEKPDEMLDLSYEKMLEQITQVKRSLVDIAASRKQLELQEQQLQHSVDHLQDQAKQSLTAGREDLAKEALARKATAQEQIDGMEPQHQQLTEEEDKLTKTLAALQTRVNQFRSQKEVLKAQYTASSAMSSVNESVAGISKSFSDSGAALQRAQDKIANMQARAGAIDELLASGALTDLSSNSDDIQAQLNKVAATSQVDAELAALKIEIAAAPVAGLPAGSPDPGETAPTPGTSSPTINQSEVTN
jgi:phage shock protein A